VTGAAERLAQIRARFELGSNAPDNADGDDAVTEAEAQLAWYDVPWLLDQLDRSVSREAAALATPPGRAAELVAAAQRASDRLRWLPWTVVGSIDRDRAAAEVSTDAWCNIVEAVAGFLDEALDDAAQEAPHG
jgi:hypothetical protein